MSQFNSCCACHLACPKHLVDLEEFMSNSAVEM